MHQLIPLLKQIDETFKSIKERNNILSEEIFPERNREDRFNGDDNDFL